MHKASRHAFTLPSLLWPGCLSLQTIYPSAYAVTTCHLIHRTPSFSTEITGVSSCAYLIWDYSQNYFTHLLIQIISVLMPRNQIYNLSLHIWLVFFFKAHLVSICVLLHVKHMRYSVCMWNYETQLLEPKIQTCVSTVNRADQTPSF